MDINMESQESHSSSHEASHRPIHRNHRDAPSNSQLPPAQSDEADIESGEGDEPEEFYDDILAEDEPDEDDFAVHNQSDYTKAYNRQRKLQETAADPRAPRSSIPKTNPQKKPTMNTFASVDDQITALSRHAGKLRLDDKLSGLDGKQERFKDKSDRATSEQVLDPRTRMLLLQMINRDVVSEVHGCVSTGKEANVYYAIRTPLDQDDSSRPIQRAIKVYKTSILTFKDRERYMTGEFRFKSGYSKSSGRAMVKLWAEKEFRNLKRIFAAGIPCPEPIYLRLHVLVMTFLGSSTGVAAPKLKDISFDGLTAAARWRALYLQLVGYMRQMYRRCRLVHADLSEYNVIYFMEKLWIIDVSQSVEHDHPRSLEFLRSDIKNISDFFARKGVNTLLERTVFEFVTSTEGPLETNDIERALDELMSSERTDVGQDDAEKEVQNEVFRQQYIPQTLEQVYDVERDVERVNKGGKDELVYGELLADKPPRGSNRAAFLASEDTQNDADNSSPVSSGDEDEDTEGGIGLSGKRTPRGKRFEDKDEKREHKRRVKGENRERREKKMPKHVKKRLISSTARNKH